MTEDTNNKPVIEDYIKEWIALENIVNKDYNATYLKQLQNDKCETYDINNCKTDTYSDCVVYKHSNGSNKCVLNTRITNFNTKSTSDNPHYILGRNGKQYEMIDTGIYQEKPEEPYIFYYYVLLSEDKIYVLFSSGIVFEEDKYIVFKEFLSKAILKIEEKYPNYHVILCGHSMGCVLALYTGMIIKEQNKENFNKKFTIIGSAPFKYKYATKFNWVINVFKTKFSYDTLDNLHNVKIFVLAFGLFGSVLFTDCFIHKGNGTKNYEPFTYINRKYDPEEKRFEYSVIEKNEYNEINDMNDNKIFRNACDSIHEWSMYYNALSWLYNKQVVSDELTTGGKQKPRRNRKSNKSSKGKSSKGKSSKGKSIKSNRRR